MHVYKYSYIHVFSLFRYLNARSFDFNKSSAMLQATLKWRLDFGLKGIGCIYICIVYMYMYIDLYAYINIYIYIRIHVYRLIYRYVCIHTLQATLKWRLDFGLKGIYIYIYVYIYVCM
jgi:hypothetical protein